MEIVHKKNTAFYLAMPMVDSATPAQFKTGVSPADVAYSKDGAAPWGVLDIADTFTQIGTTGIYEIDLTAGELDHDKVLIKVTAAGAADTYVWFNMRLDQAGSNQVDLTIEEGDTTPIPDVNISIMNSDSTVLLATGASDSNGEASFALDDGTYKVLLRRIGWTFTVPETLVVDESPETATYNGTEVSVGAPPSPDLCRMHEFCVDQEGTALAAPGPINYAAIIGRPYDDGTGAYEIKQVTGTYNSVSGLLYWDIVRGATVLIHVEQSGIHKKYVVPDAGSARLGDLTPL